MRAAVFDADGTLFDSMWVWERFASNFLESQGLLPDLQADTDTRYMCLAQSAKYFREKYGVSGTDDEICARCNKIIEDAYFNRIELRPGAAGFLMRLHHAGIPIVLATATERYLVEAALKRQGVLQLFSAIATCQEAGVGKADGGQVFFLALERAGLGKSTEGVWIFEDALHAIKTAAKCGFSVCAVADSSEVDHIDEITSLSDLYINSFSGLEPEQFK